MTDTIKKIGLISDTHGMLRRKAEEALAGVDLIIHAGDVDNQLVIDELELIAPVQAVRGNMDFKAGVSSLPGYLSLKVGNMRIGVIHNRYQLGIDPAAEGLSIIVHGHTHQASIEEINGVCYVNPGSAGPERSGKPPSLGLLEMQNDRFVPTIVRLEE